LPPGRFRGDIRIGASLDNISDVRSEAGPDPVQHGATALVLDRIMKESSDRLVLVSSRLDDESRDSEQV
jgi:hypothetical protein